MKKFLLNIICIVALVAGVAPTVSAFDTSAYAEQSALAQGTWIKVAVSQSGLYQISNATLAKYGLNAATAYVYGTGGKEYASARLTAESLRDDMVPVPCERTAQGLVFYAVGIDYLQTITEGGERHYVYFQNPYSSQAYYYVSDVAPAVVPEIPTTATPGAQNPVTAFTQVDQHELDAVSPGQTGELLVGEDFKSTKSRSFTFSLTNRVADTPIWFECSFVAKTVGQKSRLAFKVNDKAVDGVRNDTIAATTNSSYYYGTLARTRHSVDIDNGADKAVIQITHSSSVTVQSAWLDYLCINYDRQLALTGTEPLAFMLTTSQAKLANAGSNLRIWDVTTPGAPMAVDYQQEGSDASWTSDYTLLRQYVAWNDASRLPQPTVVSVVKNQNLHGLATVPNMVIIAQPQWVDQAQRLADMHNNDTENPVTTIVVTPEQVYNEFSSGLPTPHAIRAFLKMLYDRGLSQDDGGLQYLLIMARDTYDPRGLVALNKSLAAVAVPAMFYGSRESSLIDTSSCSTDDFFAILQDNGYDRPGREKLDIAVGRMPATNATDAKSMVDKTIDYVQNAKKTGWKNQVVVLSDNEDSGIHFTQAEAMIANWENTPLNPFLTNKIHLEAHTLTAGVAELARKDLFRLLDEGMAWWMFIGHASTHGWTEEGIMEYSDLNSMYLRKIPMMYAATCDFLRWDAADTSGAEMLFANRNGGIIGAISATRPVFIGDNGYMSQAFGRQLAKRDADGKLYTIGKIYQHTKSDLRASSSSTQILDNPNRLRYVLMGDPAIRVATPSNLVSLDAIDGVEVNEDNQVTLAALQRAELSGRVLTPQGQEMPTFNGVVDITIYDADKSVALTDGSDSYDTHGDRIFAGSGLAKDGKYTLQVSMPGEVADNFRPATISMYARSTAYNDLTEAISLNHDVYVYGYDLEAEPDVVPPVIEQMYLNTSSFTDGGLVDCSPMLFANIRDDVGINMSTAGIGHQMQIVLDGKTYNDVSMYYTPSADGSPSGQIAYPFDGLSVGPHELRLRIWDTSGNSATADLAFMSAERLQPAIVDVYSDASPAHDTAGFYVVTDRPDAMAKVSITVYDLMGHALWSGVTEGRNDMGVSVPVVWDLTNYAGQRVPRGIYLYRAIVTTDNGETHASAARKIAVAAQ